MSRVDVLAVLDELVADMGDTPGTTGHQIALTRAAVAELIEAAEAAHHHLKELRRRVSATSLDDADYLTEVESDTSALHAALARCQPAEIPTDLNVGPAAPVAPGVES